MGTSVKARGEILLFHDLEQSSLAWGSGAVHAAIKFSGSGI